MPTPAARSLVVTFPLHVPRDLWEQFKQRLAADESAHGVLVQYIQDVAAGKVGRKTRSRK